MKKFLYLAALGLLTLGSCSSETDLQQANGGNLEFSAMIDDAGTRAVMGGDGYATTFALNDELSLFSAKNANVKLTATSVKDGVAAFTGKGIADANYVAVYPYQVSGQMAGSALTGLNLPQQQVATKGSFDPKALLMLSSSSNGVLKFSPLCAMAKFTLKISAGADKVNNVTVNVTGDKAVSGAVTVNAATGALASAAAEASSVCMTGTFQNETTYYVVLAPNTYATFSVDVNGNNNVAYVHRLKNTPTTLEAGKVYDLGTLESTSEESAKVEKLADAIFEAVAKEDVVLKVSEKEFTVNMGEGKEEVKVEAPVIIPQEMTSGEETKPVELNFMALPVTAQNEAIVVKDQNENPTSTESQSKVKISIPEVKAGQEPPSFEITLPTTTVALEPQVGTETATYKKVVATTADNTLYVAKGVTVHEVLIKRGNVVVQGKIDAITTELPAVMYVAPGSEIGTVDPNIQIIHLTATDLKGGGYVWE